MSVFVGQSECFRTPTVVARRFPGRRFELVIAVAILFVAANPFYDLLSTKSYGTLLTQTTWLGLYVLSFALLMLRFGERWIIWSFQHLPAVVLVLTIIVLSYFWSVDASLTLRRAISLVGTCLIGLYLGLRFSPADFMRVMFWTCLMIVVLSVVTIIAKPDYGTMGYLWRDRFPDAWKGILDHKQSLGAVAGYGAVICLAMLVSSAPHRLIWFISLITFVFVVAMAKSATSLAGLFLGVTVILVLLALRRLRFQILWAFILVTYVTVLAALLAIHNLALVADFFGRDPTMTGRISVWRDALAMIGERPLTGFGYEAVWGLRAATHLPQFLKSATVAHAHNGYLNLATEAGVPAALMAAAILLMTIVRAMRAFFLEASAFLTFCIGYLIMFTAANMARAMLFAYQEFEWVLFIAVSVLVTRYTVARSKPANHGADGSTLLSSDCELGDSGDRKFVAPKGWVEHA